MDLRLPPQAKPGRRRANDPAGRRGRVLDAAADLFQTQGYAGTTMQEIGARAEVTAGALHHHFPTKKGLAAAVIRDRVRPAVTETWIEPVVSAPSVTAGVSAVFRSIESQLAEAGRVNGCPLNNLAMELSGADPDLRAEIERVFADWRAALAGRIRVDQRRGRLGKISPERLATFIVAAYSGAMAMAKTQQRPDALAQCRTELAAHMARLPPARA